VKRDLEGGGLVLSFRAPVNVGVLRWVLQYGAAVEVLAPETLRQQVRGELNRGIAAYDAEETSR
jgi:predicted DNA-binding transcriptional regulator YafY